MSAPGAMLIPDYWRGVSVECALGDLPLVEAWVALWDRLAITMGHRLPDRLSVQRHGRLVEITATRDGAFASLNLDAAELENNPASFGYAAETVMHGLFSRRGQPPVAAPSGAPA